MQGVQQTLEMRRCTAEGRVMDLWPSPREAAADQLVMQAWSEDVRRKLRRSYLQNWEHVPVKGMPDQLFILPLYGPSNDIPIAWLLDMQNYQNLT